MAIKRPLSVEHYAALGRITTETAAFELELKFTISAMVNEHKDEYGLRFTYRMNLDPMMEIFKSLLVYFFPRSVDATPIKRELSNIVTLIKTRNRYIHSHWLIGMDDKTAKRIKMVLRKNLIDFETEPISRITPGVLNKLADDIHNSRIKFRFLFNQMLGARAGF